MSVVNIRVSESDGNEDRAVDCPIKSEATANQLPRAEGQRCS